MSVYIIFMNEKLDQILEELSLLRTLLEFYVKPTIIEEIMDIATTLERKKIWALLDGKSSTEDLANECHITQRAVQIFIKELSERKLVNLNKRGYPKRRFDVIPDHWRI